MLTFSAPLPQRVIFCLSMCTERERRREGEGGREKGKEGLSKSAVYNEIRFCPSEIVNKMENQYVAVNVDIVVSHH